MVLCLIARRLDDDDDDDDDDDVDDVSLRCRRDAFNLRPGEKRRRVLRGLRKNSSSRRVSESLNERCARDECEEHDVSQKFR